MKTRVFATLGVCLATVLGSGTYAKAATAALMTVTLPQDAMMGKVALPAGEYLVHELFSGSGAGVLEFTSSSGRSVNVLVSEIDAPGDRPAAHSSVVLRPEDGK